MSLGELYGGPWPLPGPCEDSPCLKRLDFRTKFDIFYEDFYLTDLRFLQKVDGRLLSSGRDKGHGRWGWKHGRCSSARHGYNRLLPLVLLRFWTLFLYRGCFSRDWSRVITFVSVASVGHLIVGLADFFNLCRSRRRRFGFTFVQRLEKIFVKLEFGNFLFK